MSTSVDTLVAKAKTRMEMPDPRMRKLIREEAELTQEDIAQALGVTRAAICRYERGQRDPRGALLDTYAMLLDRLKREVLG